MNSICIITDNTAQFITQSFVGKSNTRIVPFTIELNGQPVHQEDTIPLDELPSVATAELNPKLVAPSRDLFRQLFLDLGDEYNEVIGIFSSSKLTDCFENAKAAISSQLGSPKILLIDSLSTSFGLGYLVQIAAEAVIKGANCIDIERKLRNIIQRSYAIFCIPGLSYLHYSGFLDQAQAIVGDMLGAYSIFAIEEGFLTPVEKVRSRRNILLYFQEFLDEFEKLESLALIQGVPMGTQEIRSIREHIRSNFHNSIYSEHVMNLPLALLFGPQSLGLFVIEKESNF